MSEEAKPWRAWPEWAEIAPDCTDDFCADHQESNKALDALCARVWREAEKIPVALGQAIEKQWQEEEDRRRAAEAQLNRLAAAWRDTLRRTCLFTEAQIEERIARAALARPQEQTHDG